MLKPVQFQSHILNWFDQFGRKDLPWQKKKTPYRVWISEIMLQQTQVKTVIPYFQRFIKEFPSVRSLAKASVDEVFHLWTGLGYYQRARNLHQAAKFVMDHHKGKIPDDLENLLSLPGIGRSTAGAILAMAFNQQAAILDGNVKRLFARCFGVEIPINTTSGLKELWQLAELYASARRPSDYTQTLMDIGATVCTPKHPLCQNCPLDRHCYAKSQHKIETIPLKKPAKQLPIRDATFLVLQKNNSVLLNQRLEKGVWKGLWSFPEYQGLPELSRVQKMCEENYAFKPNTYASLASFRHTFTHFHLHIFPILIKSNVYPKWRQHQEIWYDMDRPAPIGLPKPVQLILQSILQ